MAAFVGVIVINSIVMIVRLRRSLFFIIGSTPPNVLYDTCHTFKGFSTKQEINHIKKREKAVESSSCKSMGRNEPVLHKHTRVLQLVDMFRAHSG